MTEKHKRYIKRAFGITSDVVTLCLGAMLTVVLIATLTVVIFGCIFAVYVKAIMSEGFNLSLESFPQNLSSVIYYTDPETGAFVESTTIQSPEYRIWLEYSEIPKNVERALVAIEDQRFYKHSGVDWYRTTGALVNMFISMRDNFGGSTITQQLIKNLTGEDDVTVQRKLEEIFRALEFERTYTKEEIIQWYLNIVYFGRGSYGLAAAADTYFGKEASALTIPEIASLVAIPNNPSLYDPFVRPEKNMERQETILEQMFIQGYIDAAEYRAYVAEDV
ncbi:MAG: transglycosylase domain-containing protein, partial [Clostridiales bacterium]|nr:transglycosylase domain-containing protein [Clostridiales bacterium]